MYFWISVSSLSRKKSATLFERLPDGKGHGSGVDKHTQQHIPLCRLEQQLDVVPGQNENEHQGDNGNRAIGTDSQYGQKHGIKAAEVQRRQVGCEDPLVGGSSDLQDGAYNAVGAVSQQEKQNTA